MALRREHVAVMDTGVVVIGAGVLGASVAYHLARAGNADVLVVERNEVGSGTTSSSAGLLGQLRATPILTRLVWRTLQAIGTLEKERGESFGFRRVGSLRIASTPERERELGAHVDVARGEGVEVEMIDGATARRLVPALDVTHARAIAYVPSDGFIDAYQLASAYASAARARGVTIWTGTGVTGIQVDRGRVVGVTTDRGVVACRAVVDAAGAWVGPVASLAGVTLAQAPIRSHFWITAPRSDVAPDQPVVRLPDANAYTRPEVGGLLVGIQEPRSRVYDARQLPPTFEMRQVDRDWDVLIEHLPSVLRFLPDLEDAEMVDGIAGLTTYTPDGRYLVGEVPEVEGFLVAGGCCGLGVAGSGGIGSAIAELLLGEPALDMTPFRPDRFGPVTPYDPAFLELCAAARSGKNRLTG